MEAAESLQASCVAASWDMTGITRAVWSDVSSHQVVYDLYTAAVEIPPAETEAESQDEIENEPRQEATDDRPKRGRPRLTDDEKREREVAAKKKRLEEAAQKEAKKQGHRGPNLLQLFAKTKPKNDA